MKKIIKIMTVVLILLSTTTNAQELSKGQFFAKTGSAVYDSLQLKVTQTTTYSTATQYTVYNGNNVYAPGYIIVVAANSLVGSKKVAVVPGTNYTFKVKSSRTGCFSNTICFSISTLAMKNLTLLSASSSDKGVTISWNMLKDDDVDHYVIEKSLDGITFKQTAYFLTGGSTSFINYSYIDKEINGTIFYYRLCMVNRDGKTEYSNIVVVNLKLQKQNDVQVTAYPNPVVNTLTVLLDGKPLSGKDRIQILDIFGKVAVEQIPVGSTVNVSKLPNGEYVFKVIIEKTKKSLTTLIIKH